MGQALRFGIIRNNTLPWPEILRQWQAFDRLGFDSVWMTDHFQRPSDPSGPHLECWSMLGAVAACTERVRLGVLVCSNTFRHPALLAKQAVTVDHISNGRLEIGLGTGWFEAEHTAFGFDFPEPAVRVAMLEEAVQVVDALMRNDVTTFDGAYYHLHEAPFRPGPVQLPRPPLTLGAHGPRMLRLTARFADRWNSYGTVAEIAERNAALDAACAAVGRDPDAIIRSLYGWPKIIGRDPWSSEDAFREAVAAYRAVGVNEFIFEPPTAAQWETMERICRDVIPALRAGE
jgi:F420-dependent oxidoreductase-like protein